MACGAASAAQQSTPRNRPRYRVLSGSVPNQLWFFCNGSRAHDGRCRTRGSSLGRGSGGPISTSRSVPRNTNQCPPPGACAETRGS